jgi:hypothetical protein
MVTGIAVGKDDRDNPLRLIVTFSFAWCLLLSMKQGSGDYYFLGASLLGTLWVVQMWGDLQNRPLVAVAFAAGLSFQLLAVTLVLTGRAGVIADADEQQRHSQLAEALDPLPAPVLVGERFGNLPWIQRKPPHFVYGYTYFFDRAAGRQYERGGLAGLIREHYFKTIVLRNPNVPSDQGAFDGELLAGYRRTQSVAGYDFFALTESSP